MIINKDIIAPINNAIAAFIPKYININAIISIVTGKIAINNKAIIAIPIDSNNLFICQ